MLLAIALLGIAVASASAATRYVKHDATGTNNGTSWANAYTTLQPAITAAVSGDEVWVAAGTYKPTSWPNGGSTDREMHFSLKNGVAVYGGFDGAETLLAERDIAANPTICSGDIGVAGDISDNCQHIIYHPSGVNLDGTAIIDGFTIAAGNCTDASGGAGMYNYSSSPTIGNCIFSENFSDYGNGAGIRIESTTTTPVFITNCQFKHNYAGRAAAIWCNASTATITDCVFTDNHALFGGAFMTTAGTCVISNGTFVGNSAPAGGAIWHGNPATLSVVNSTFVDNHATDGGCVLTWSSAISIVNCTMIRNRASVGGGISIHDDQSPIIINTILWDDGDSPIYSGSPVVSYCLVEGGYAGGTNIITGDPMLEPLADNGGATLTCAIPLTSVACAIPESAGGNWNDCPVTDQRGFSRPASGNRAIGAYQPGVGKPALRTVPLTNITGDGADSGGSFVEQGSGYTVNAKGLCWGTGENPTAADSHVGYGSGFGPLVGSASSLTPGVIYHLRAYAELDDGSFIYGQDLRFQAYRRAHVVTGGAGAMDGSSWANAYADPQIAIDSASEVWVAAGSYKPNLWPNGGSAVREKHFSLRNNTTVYGGFAGTEALLNERNIAAHPTIFSGDIGTVGVKTDNCYHVFNHPANLGLDATAVLDGVTVTAGYAMIYPNDCGAGMYQIGSSPTLNNCTVSYNTAGSNGAGIYNRFTLLVIDNCVFSQNALTGGSANSGAGLYNENSFVTIIDSFFHDNSSENVAAGMSNWGSVVSLCNTTIANNSADFVGGIQSWSSSLVMTNCTLSGNAAISGSGGGMSYSASATHYNSIIINNCTFTDNTAVTSGGGISGGGDPLSTTTVSNSIFWGNTNEQIVINTIGDTYTVTYCVVEGGFANGTNIITDDPMLEPLADNGGATPTCAIPADSVAYAIPESAGGNWNGSPDPDQRGNARASSGYRAMGAYESIRHFLSYHAGPHGAIAGMLSQVVYEGGDGVPVTATPDIGSHFVDWSDTSIANPRQDTSVSGDLTVTANFAVNVYALAYHADANGAIAGAAAQTVFHGSDGSPVTADPDEGFHLVEWSDHSTANPRQDTSVTGDIEVTATFSINVYTLTYLSSAGGSVTGQATQTATHGADGSEVVADPDVGHHFVQWSDGVLTAARTDLDITANLTVTAQFAIDTFSVIFHAGANGSLAGASTQTVEYGTDATSVTANPDVNHHFVDWAINGGAGNGTINTGVNPLLITNVIGPIEVTANFAINTYTVTFQTDGTAGATLNGVALVTDIVDHGGTTIEVTATAPAELSFLGWTGDHVGGENPLTIANVTADMTITARFGYLLAQGASFAILAGDVGMDEFTAKPKVYAVYANPVSGKVGQKASAKVLTKINANTPADTVDCEWIKKIKLFSARNFAAAQKLGETADQWLGLVANQQPLIMTLHARSKQADPVDQTIHSMQLMPPAIDAIVDGGQDAKGNDTLIITGTWFGTKRPKVWREYADDKTGAIKHQAMKTVKPTEADALAGFVDSKGKPAFMNAATGASKATVIVPAKEPNGVLNGTIVLENGVGLATGNAP